MKTPIWILATHPLIFAAFALLSLPIAYAQDPFSLDGPGTPDTDLPSNSLTNAKQVLSNRFDPNEQSSVVLSLRAHPPSTAPELARAIQLMARIRRWDEVGYWLDESVKLGLSEATATQMVQTAGTQTFLQLLSLDARLSELQKSNAKKILELASAAVTNPKKLAETVANLRSTVKAERIRAHRSLESAGNRGVSALINHLLAEGAAAPNATMCESFSLMDKPAFAAWQAAMSSPHADARGRLAMLAARSGEQSLTAELCVAAIDANVDPGVRHELAQVAAARNKSIPNSQAVYRHVINQMQVSLSAFQKNRWVDEPDAYVSWHLSPDGRTVQERAARLADLDWRRAVQLASAAVRCGESADRSSGLAIAVMAEDMAYSNIDVPNKATIATIATIATVAPGLPKLILDSYEFACLVWDAAESNSLANAQLLAVQNLERWATPTTMPGAVRDRLSVACSSGFAPVRYAAAQAMLSSMHSQSEDGSFKLVDTHFDGRNRLERVLAEMRKLEGSPLALVVGGAADLRTHLRTLLETFGYRVMESASASQAMSTLRDGQPIEAIFIVSKVLEMNLGELTQRVRANPSTATCPIAILAASLSKGEHEVAAADQRVVLGSVPPEQAGLVDVLRRMKIVTQAPQIDSSNRIVWRELSAGYWAERQGLYVSAQPKAAFATAIDTPVGQLQSIQLAIDNSRSLPQREQASQNFVQSVKQFGVLLSSETVKAQYDEYNKRGPDEIELRLILGRILDAIEAAKGDRPWDEVAP